MIFFNLLNMKQGTKMFTNDPECSEFTASLPTSIRSSLGTTDI